MRRLVGCVLFLVACGSESGSEMSGADTGSSTAAVGSTGPGGETGSGSSGGPSEGTSSSSGQAGESTGEPEPEVEWELDEGHFYPAVMEPVVVYPRADDETQSWARHRWAHPDIEYRIPAAVVQGGAWPFRYELLEGPPGAQVGETLHWEGERMVADEDYGVLSWTPTAADAGQSFGFVVRVTDQEGTQVEARWTTTVDATRFVFMAPDGDDAASGSVDAPLQTVAGWYRDDPADDSFADRLVYVREGNYTPVGSPTNNENLRMEVGRKPMTVMAVPGERVVFDASRASWTYWEGTEDVFFAGIEFDGSKIEQPDGSMVRNARVVSFYGAQNHDRITFFENTVRNLQPGHPDEPMVGNDNPAFVWRPSSSSNRGHHWAFVGNHFDTAGPRTSNGPSAVSLSCVSYVVYERNRVENWASTGTFFDKANNDHVTQRNNDLWHVAADGGSLGHGLGAGMSGSYDENHAPGYFETCWNRIRSRDMGVQELAVQVGLSSEPGDGPAWLYRNSIRGKVAFVRLENFEAVADRNVLQGGYVQSGEVAAAEGDNVEILDWDAAPFDADGWLTETVGEARGTHGADVR